MTPQLRLTIADSPSILTGRQRPGEVYEGADAAEVLDAWNANYAWHDLSPLEFRKHMVWMTGADVVLPAEDDEILEALVAKCPDLKLDDVG